MISKFLLLLAPLVYALAMFRVSAFQTRRRLRRQSTSLSDPKLQRLNARLASAAGIPEITTSIYEVGTVNGLTTPEGDLYLTRGLFECYRRGEISAEELSSVTAHELGHVALGHGKRRLTVFAGQNAARMLLGFMLGRFIPFVGPSIADGLTSLLVSRLSRDDEYAADKYASALLIKAGLGTGVQKTMLQSLEHMTGHTGGAVAWLMSHPPIPKRIAAIENNERRWKSPDGPDHNTDLARLVR